MAKPHRVRRAAKWAGLAVCLAIVAVFVASGYWAGAYLSESGFNAGVARGRFGFGWIDLTPPAMRVFPTGGLFQAHTVPFSWWFETQWTPYQRQTSIPLWFPFLLTAIPTAFLWYRDRRRVLPGHCRCGYDLTGNTSGKCPECGRAIGVTADADA